MDFLLDYAGFLARAVTVLVVVVAILSLAAAMRSRGRTRSGDLSVTSLNDFYLDLKENLECSVLDKAQLKELKKANKAKQQQDKKSTSEKKRVYVLDFDGDIKASAAENLRHEITALLSIAKPSDEVVLRLESGGGMVHSYGFAASQLARIRQAQIPLTVCIDKVAASGGYMMACIADRILVAPFAMLGSIGVVAQLPNFHRVLKKHDVDYEMLTAGEYKRTLTVFGENTDKGREKFQEDLERIHQLFKQFVTRYRPALDVDAVATGEVWFGVEALEQLLADEVKTSDEYVNQRIHQADVFEVHFVRPKRLQDRLASSVSAAMDRLVLTWVSRLHNQRFW